MSDRNTPDDGGQAFPSGLCPDDKGDTHAMHLGMTLRDYFAAKAMQGMYAWTDGSDSGGSYQPRIIADDYVPVDDPKDGGWYFYKSESGYWRQQNKRNATDGPPHLMRTTYEQQIAREAFAIADAMLAARKATGGGQ